MKWFFKMGVATALTVSMTTTAFGEMQINANTWAIPGMEKAYELELISQEMLLHGTENITREEFTKMAVQFYRNVTGERINIDNIHNPFWDTNQPEIVFAYSLGIITGKEEHIFEPKGSLTREQMAIIVVRTLEKSNIELKEIKEEISFKDVNKLEKSVLPYIKKVQMAGIMNGFENMFSPFKEVTVEEAAVAFASIYENMLPDLKQKSSNVTTTEQEQISTEIKKETPVPETEPTKKQEEPKQEISAESDTPKQETKEEIKQENASQQEEIVINGKSISIGQSVSKLKADWGTPSRIDQNSYSLERYIYINDYKHFFMVSIKEDKVAEIFTNDMTFQYKGITGKMDANDIKNVKYLDLKNFRAELQEEGKDSFVLLNKDYKAEGILIRSADYKQGLQLRYSQQFLSDFKTELIDIFNSARIQEGAPTLISDETAENVAYYHSWDMSKNGYVGYTNLKGENPFDRMTAGGVKYTMAGESVVKIESGDAIDAYHQIIMEAGTRTNMLNPELTHYGLSAFDTNFTIYITLDLFAPAKE